MSVAVAPVNAPPRAGFRRLARDSALYASGAVAGKAIGLLLLPIVTRALSPEDFGRLDVLSTLQSAVGCLILLGLDTGATRLYADLGAVARPRMFATWLTFTATLALPVAVVLGVYREQVSELVFGTPAHATAVALTGLVIGASCFYAVALTVLRNEGRPGAFAAVNTVNLGVYGAVVVALLAWRASVTVVLAGMLAGFTVAAVTGLLVGRKAVTGRPSPDLGRRLLALGIPLLPAVAATWVAEFANRAILVRVAGPTEVGYFSVATRFASVGVLVVLGFQAAWQPRAFATAAAGEPTDELAEDGRRILVTAGVLVALVAIVTPELVHVLAGSAYDAAIPAVGLCLVFAVAFAGFHVASMPSAMAHRMRDLGLATAIGTLLGIGLNVWWAGAHGSTGTAAAVAIGQAVAFAIAVALGRRARVVAFAWGRIAVVLAAVVGVVLAATLPDGGAAPVVRLALGSALAAGLWIEGSLKDLRPVAGR